MAGLLIVVVVDFLVVDDELVEVLAAGDEVVFIGPVEDVLELALAFGGGQFPGEIGVKLVDLHLIGTLPVALGSTNVVKLKLWLPKVFRP